MGLNKKNRTEELINRGEQMLVREIAQNDIEESGFKRLLRQGRIDRIRTEREMQKVLV